MIKKYIQRFSLFSAIEREDVKKLDELLAAGVDVNAKNGNGFSALIEAVKKNNPEMVAKLLKAGADAEAKSPYGDSPLIWASAMGAAGIAGMLVAYDDEIDARNNLGYTALMVAVKDGHAEIVSILIDAGADIESQTRDFYASLHLAVAYRHYDVVKLLIEAGADLDAQTAKGSTPLMVAAVMGDYNICELLLEGGADLNIPNNAGRTPLTVSDRQDRGAIHDLLMFYQATRERKIPVLRNPIHEKMPAAMTPQEDALPKKTGDFTIQSNDRVVRNIFMQGERASLSQEFDFASSRMTVRLHQSGKEPTVLLVTDFSNIKGESVNDARRALEEVKALKLRTPGGRWW